MAIASNSVPSCETLLRSKGLVWQCLYKCQFVILYIFFTFQNYMIVSKNFCLLFIFLQYS